MAYVANLDMVYGYSHSAAVSQRNGQQPALLFELVSPALPDSSFMLRDRRRLFQKPARGDSRTGEDRDFGGRSIAGAKP